MEVMEGCPLKVIEACPDLQHLALSFESVSRVNQNHVGCEVRRNKHNHLIRDVLEDEVLPLLQAPPARQRTHHIVKYPGQTREVSRIKSGNVPWDKR